METNELKKKGISAVFWNLSGTVMKQGITFVISIFLARLLSPADFGLVGMATVFIAFTQGFADLGLTSGLIQTKNPTDSQYNSVFIFNLAVSIVLALAMFFSAGLIANYYENPEIKSIVRFVSYSFVIFGLNSVHQAILYKNLDVKITRISSVVSALVTGIVGILLALNGFGVWSLVYSGLAGGIVSVIIIWNYSKWRPKLEFKFADIKELMPFGIRVFAINYLDQIYSKIDVLIIGKIFSPAILGQYFRASSFNQLVTKYTSQSLSGVVFPVISNLQDDYSQIRNVYLKLLSTLSFLSFFLTGLLFVLAEPLIVILFSDKWLPAVDYFKVIAFSSYVYPLTILFNGVLLGTGNSGPQLKLELIKKGLGVSGLIIGFFFGLNGYLWSLVISATIGVFFSFNFVKKAIDFNVIKSIYNLYIYAIPMLLSVWVITFVNQFLNGYFFVISIDIIIYIIMFSLINILLKTTGFDIIRRNILKLIESKFKHK